MKTCPVARRPSAPSHSRIRLTPLSHRNCLKVVLQMSIPAHIHAKLFFIFVTIKGISPRICRGVDFCETTLQTLCVRETLAEHCSTGGCNAKGRDEPLSSVSEHT